MSKTKIHYYTDELNDDFAGGNIKTKQTPPDFKYVHTNPIWRVIEFIVYQLIVRPLAWIISKFLYGVKIKNRKVLKQAKGKGIFIYGNHVVTLGDAFHPNLVSFPRKSFIVVHPDTTSIPLIKNLVVMLGALPLPSGKQGYRNFTNAIKTRIEQKQAVVIYPEAHLWPMFTGIRPFKNDSFLYPSMLGAPVFCTTTVLKNRRFRKPPKCIVYVDGPFYPDENLSFAENKQKLRDEVYAVMCERAKESNYDKVKYVKVTPEELEAIKAGKEIQKEVPRQNSPAAEPAGENSEKDIGIVA